MKKNTLYTVTSANKPFIEKKLFGLGGFDLNSDYNKGSNFGGISFPSIAPSASQPSVIGGLDPKELSPLSSKTPSSGSSFMGNFGSGLVGGLSAIGDIPTEDPRGMWDTADPLFHLADGRESGVGNAFSDVGVGLTKAGLSSGQPWLALAGGVTKAFGSLFNAAFGIKENKENTNFIKNNTANAFNMGNKLASTTTNADLVNQAGKMVNGSGFHWNNLYENGWFTSKGTRLGNNLIKKENTALAIQGKGLRTGADNIDSISDTNVMRRYAAFGGPIGYQPMGLGALGIMQQNAYLDTLNNRSSALSKTPLSGSFAFGGELGTNGTDFTNGLLHIDEGGTHESNPLGGVPMGIDAEGVPNLVEEDETVFDDYVFSNRIKVPKSLYHEFGLGGVVNRKGITFAEASKKLAKESEQRPNDTISIDGLRESLGKLASVQEAERMKEQMKEYIEDNSYAYGGLKGNILEGKGNKPNTLNINPSDLNKSTIRRLFGNAPWVYSMENFSEAVADPVNYFAGDQIDAIMGKVAEMSEPQLEAFFSTPVGQYIATNLVPEEGTPVQESGVNRWYKATSRMAKPMQKAMYTAAKRAMAQSKAVARGQMKITPKGAGRIRVKNPESPLETAKRTAGSYWEQHTQLPAVRPSSEVAALGQRGIVPALGQRGIVPVGPTALSVIAPPSAAPVSGFNWAPWLAAGTAGSVASIELADALNNKVIDPTSGADLGGLADMLSKKPKTGGTEKGTSTVAEPLDVGPSRRGIGFPTLEETIAAQVRRTPVKKEGLAVPQKASEWQLNPNAGGNGYKPLPTWMRYAPLMNPFMYSSPDYSDAQRVEAAADRVADYTPAVFTPVGGYVDYTPLDIMYEQNRLDANARATDRIIANSGNPAKMAGLVATGYNSQLAGADLFRKAQEYNDAKRMQVADFNRKTDMFNSQMGLEAAMANSRIRQQAEAARLAGIEQAAAMRDAIDARVSASNSANYSNMLQSLANIGRENFIMNQINGDDAWNYGVDRSGLTPFKKGKKCGGKINRR